MSLASLGYAWAAVMLPMHYFLFRYISQWGDSEVDITCKDRYINIKAPERSGLEFKESQIHKVGHLLNTVRLLHHPVVILENGSHYHHTP